MTRDPDHWRPLLGGRLRTLVRESVSRFPGTGIRAQGDGIFAMLPSASGAVPRGHRRLKGVDGPPAVFSVGVPSAQVGPSLGIELLGRFQITWNGQRIDAVRGARQEALIAYLSLHRADGPIRREQLAPLLWPESSDAQALTNLRRELHLLRAALPDPEGLLELQHRTVGWRPAANIHVDVSEFEAAVRRGQTGDETGFEEAAAHYRGPLLPTCYDDWIGPERERLHGLYLATVERLAAELERLREYTRASQLLRQLVAIEPAHEPAYEALMRLALASGNRSAGLQAYHAAVGNLRRELGVEPGPELQALRARMLRAREAGTPAASPTTTSPLPPLVGRAAEWATMVAAWRHVVGGATRLLLLRGEAGIGKTRLLDELVRWCRSQGVATASTRSYAAEGTLAYAPIADWLRGPPIRAAMRQLDAVWLSELARLLPELLTDRPGLAPPAPMTESWQRTRLFEAILQAVRLAPMPLLLVLDDVQWADDETLAWVHYLLRDEDSSGILVAVGLRKEEEDANGPLRVLLRDLVRRDQLVRVDLGSLTAGETTQLGNQVAGRNLEPEVQARLYRETEGHPLYVVELARVGLQPTDDDGRGPAASRIPPRVQAVIAARLELLSETARAAVEVAATVGRAYTVDLLLAVGDLEESELMHALDELWRREVIQERGLNAYDFVHDRIREVAYAAIPPMRRRLLHRRIAQALELTQTGDPDAASPEIAAQYDAAGLAGQAVDWYERAARSAVRLSANAEAVQHLRRAVALLGQLPASSERDRREVQLRMALGPPLVADRGYASGEFAEAAEQLQALAERLADDEAVAYALTAIAAARFVRAQFGLAIQAATRATDIAVARYPDLITAAEASAGGALTALGQIDAALVHFEAAVAGYLPGRSRMPTGIEPGAFAMSWESHALWLSGAATRARERYREAIDRSAAHGPHTMAMANAYGAILLHWLGDETAMVERARAAVELCARYGFAYYGEWGQMLLAWSERESQPSTAAARIEEALRTLRSIGAESRRPYFLSLLADTHAAGGDHDRGRAVLGAALSTADANEDRFWVPELLRSLAHVRPSGDLDAGLRQAIRMARDQGNRSLALRAALDLARARPDAGDALEVLAAVVADLPDGETRPAEEARRILAIPRAVRG